MPTPRNNQVSALLHNGQVLVAGGNGVGGPRSDALLYNPATGTWSAAAPMLHGVAAGPTMVDPTVPTATTLADGRVLVVGMGLVAGVAGPVAQLYDPTKDAWTAGPNLPIALNPESAGLFPDGRVIVVGHGVEREAGQNKGAPEAVMYNPATNTWTTLPAPPYPSQNGPEVGTMLPNGSFFTTFGQGTSMYTPSTNKWTSFRRAPVNLPDKPAIALMLNGHVMVTGGSNWGFGFPTPRTEVQEINPTTGAWSTDPKLPRDYYYPSPYLFDGSELVALGNGAILATGGILGTDLDYVYGPDTATWTSVPGRNAHGGTIIKLANGSVLVAGGMINTAYPSQGTTTDQSYIFTP